MKKHSRISLSKSPTLPFNPKRDQSFDDFPSKKGGEENVNSLVNNLTKIKSDFSYTQPNNDAINSIPKQNYV